jgi:hypothetical protein
MMADNQPLSFWRTVRLLLAVSRKRALGRGKRQQELLNNRSKRAATDWSVLGYVLSIGLMALINILAAVVLDRAVVAAERADAERHGTVVVSEGFLNEEQSDEAIRSEAKSIADEYGGTKEAAERKLRDALVHGSTLATKDVAARGLVSLPSSYSVAALTGSLLLLLWGSMLVFQGEGLELDIQRRRHPMWEWLFTHPVSPGAVFLAEMLSPIAANPIYWCAPLFPAVLYGMVYSVWLGCAALFLIGVPLAIAAACLGKALEIAVMLRLSPRTRGGLIGLMSWFGYATMMLFFVGMILVPRMVTALADLLGYVAAIPWPWLGLFLGRQLDGSYSFAQGLLSCWFMAVVITTVAVWFSVWSAQQGLSGNFAAEHAGPAVVRSGSGPRFGRDPLFRKELLWFIRDRSAIVQVILIPLTVAGYQVFNLRGLLSRAEGQWNYLCGVGIFFGTYFLWILGPKSLSSEGAALWIALTWPRGLESLLKAKAWLWSMISCAMVALVLGYAAFQFPREIWKIALVGIAWYFFGRSMAEKTVTLVTITSESGEKEKIPRGRLWAAQLGMLTFAIGVLAQQWHIAIMGIVYSFITAAAMWQNFRARLPYLYDPWSERVPPAPTLMHAMISISILVEAGAVATGLLMLMVGRENVAIAQTFSYGICAVAVSIGVSEFLSNREVTGADIWCIREPGAQEADADKSWWIRYGFGDAKFLPWLAVGVGGGVLLGLFAHGYMAVLEHVPWTAEMIRKSQEQMDKIPNVRIWSAVMAVLFAPFAEEYLFRGLLFRALDREWGGWRAVLGSAAFFAIYHSPMAWLPVGMLGAANALLFKKSGKLAPAVLLHMFYNAVVSLNF